MATSRFLKRNGQLLFLDAAELLSSFMADGTPDTKLFNAGIKALMDYSGHHPYTGRERQVRLFGEMVNILWPTHAATAERLEELWKEVIDQYSVPLL